MAPKPIPDRWLDYKPFGERVSGTQFIAFKVPLREDVVRNVTKSLKLSCDSLLEMIPNLGMIIDLTNTLRYYNPNFFSQQGVKYAKLQIPGHEVPPKHLVHQFNGLVHQYLQQDGSKGKLIGVHCTHGVNRTGYLICKFMISEMKMEPSAAIESFEAARGHKIERRNYTDDLFGRSFSRPPVVQDDWRNRHRNSRGHEESRNRRSRSRDRDGHRHRETERKNYSNDSNLASLTNRLKFIPGASRSPHRIVEVQDSSRKPRRSSERQNPFKIQEPQNERRNYNNDRPLVPEAIQGGTRNQRYSAERQNPFKTQGYPNNQSNYKTDSSLSIASRPMAHDDTRKPQLSHEVQGGSRDWRRSKDRHIRHTSRDHHSRPRSSERNSNLTNFSRPPFIRGDSRKRQHEQRDLSDKVRPSSERQSYKVDPHAVSYQSQCVQDGSRNHSRKDEGIHDSRNRRYSGNREDVHRGERQHLNEDSSSRPSYAQKAAEYVRRNDTSQDRSISLRGNGSDHKNVHQIVGHPIEPISRRNTSRSPLRKFNQIDDSKRVLRSDDVQTSASRDWRGQWSDQSGSIRGQDRQSRRNPISLINERRK